MNSLKLKYFPLKFAVGSDCSGSFGSESAGPDHPEGGAKKEVDFIIKECKRSGFYYKRVQKPWNFAVESVLTDPEALAQNSLG